ncbi:hypothetical protein [Catenuloplanes indicus]|uniref:Uncharacterized protein n=1 Tax=Catenuloplanes indicus TaxID=137267 RepID=A0AAE4AXA0_9ACTN|nr:hypothetical protein [Catenuloplanes indicus]MDQ0363858.1 hypothetical protein [Catenuloplanes indicus]
MRGDLLCAPNLIGRPGLGLSEVMRDVDLIVSVAPGGAGSRR